ncbi:MAG: Membrane-bound lytic murein transglycosylase F [Chroococcidiopsis cubana SAG 39.79]|uniref:Amino acid ABC transporter substrate-binding protein n=1 Tax=Chroococcidiopsis cubana SAG 39.79 TaxID=388085 RepID=A0AB37UQY9_9CYAN|nr:transporter substrate-binding domain-containing protein [Chroococcidiopsis cubana]MDZ4873718.1 Membrane-bound lytic murein transglycosylase F [Chroococcidiopsis cubana SAG 39.79]PSB63991.1 ABC transporter substrate-binding protein [Chroococcidiopsis cubana CCALA 043]RUT13602.1 amino acid ABC transporter substrate-binding protein [Chroococcidiopsis cubana SAG 39.79]
MNAIPKKWLQFITLFLASLLMMASIAACNSSESSYVKSMSVTSGTASATSLPGVNSGTTLKQIQSTGKVRVAVPDDFPPFGAVGPDMQVRGYDIDVAREIAKGLGVELELVPVVGNYRIPFLQTNRVDMVISSLGKNKERAKIIDFSIPYAPFFSGIYGRQNVKVASMEDLKGRTVGVAQGSLEDLELSKLPTGTVKMKRFASNSLTASALVSGQVELIATGNVVAAKLMRDNPDKQIDRKLVLKNSPCYIGVRRGDTDLLQRVNAIITDLKTSGKLNSFSQKWLGEPLAELPTV